MIDTILNEIQELTLGDKRRLIEATKAAVARELGFGAGDAPAACPRCGSADFVRKGHGRDGSQRWLCRGCGRTFSRKTMGLLALSKLPPETWGCTWRGCCRQEGASGHARLPAMSPSGHPGS